MPRTAANILASLLIAVPSTAFADSLCQGRVTQTSIVVDGTVTADWGFGVQRV